MKVFHPSVAFLAAVIGLAAADADISLINGNWYGKVVSGISYSNWGVPGTYNQITYMKNGQCKSSPFDYAGGMSPLDGEVRNEPE